MRYALDASVALKWELPEPDSDRANQLRDDFRSRAHDLIAPDTFILEMNSAKYSGVKVLWGQIL